jgi:hypothetical protein
MARLRANSAVGPIGQSRSTLHMSQLFSSCLEARLVALMFCRSSSLKRLLTLTMIPGSRVPTESRAGPYFEGFIIGEGICVCPCRSLCIGRLGPTSQLNQACVAVRDVN